jgi:Glycosyltransferase family 87
VTWVRAGAVGLLVAAWCLTFLVDPWQDELVNDVPLYRAYADVFLDGVLPYRDIGFEYPPLAAPLIAVPGLVSLDPETYRYAFAVLTFALAAGVLFATGRLAALGGGREWVALLVVALAPVAAGAMIRTHFDLAPVLCLVAGIASVAAGRSRVGFLLFGLGGALKLFPLAAAAVAAAWLLGRGRKGEAATGLAISAVVAGLAVAAALAVSAEGSREAVEYHVERPVQIESLPASVLSGIEALGGEAPDPVHSHRSDGLEHSAADAISAGFIGLLCASVVALILAARRLDDVRGLGIAALASAAALASLGKVLSPQFMLWLIPLAAVALAWRMYALGLVTTAAVAATLAWFPDRYFDLVDREDTPLIAVGVRNGLLLLMLVLIARQVRRLVRESRAEARSTPHVHPDALRSAPH